MFQIRSLLDAIGITYTEVQCLRLQRLVMKEVLEEIFKAITPTSQKPSQAIDMLVSEDDDDNLNFENTNDDNLNDDNFNDDNPKNGNPNDDNSNDDNSNDGNPNDNPNGNPNDYNPSDDNPNDDNNDNDDVQGALDLSVKFFAIKVQII